MPRITELWAYVAEDAGPDDEGIIGARLANGDAMPLVGADEARMRSLRQHAETMARRGGVRVKLVRFTAREELEVVHDPEGRK